MTHMPSQNEMFKAFMGRDPAYDGLFYTGVKTTSIFCLPSCSAKKPKKENIEYFRTVQEATFSGYRPCKRCHPMSTNGKNPTWFSDLVEKVDRDPSVRIKDQDLREMSLDPATVRRIFQKKYGMTFQAYCRARRLQGAFEQIRNGVNLFDVAFDHGYESNSGFRDAFKKAFGRSPGRRHDVSCITVTWLESPVGPLIAGTSEKGICLLEFTDRRMLEAQFRSLEKRFGLPMVPGKHKYLDQLRQELQEYFDRSRKGFDVPLDYPGSDFQRAVWKELLKIPYGKTCSYQDIARRVGKVGAVRAVGRTNGLNRIAIVIPCHRVVNKSGNLGGYGGGLRRKEFLLGLENG